MARIGRQVLAFLPLMRDTEAQVARLAEMHADDAATQARDPRPLATALVVLATAGNPAPALAAAATDAVQRIHGLLGPPSHRAAPAGSCSAPPPPRSS
jgi:Zn-dependent protease with chaperone function